MSTEHEMEMPIKDMCGFEGVGGRPTDCKNNPWRYPNNNRPEVCYKCIINPEITKISEIPLPSIYIRYKQTGKF
jgi:hypothetical protein